MPSAPASPQRNARPAPPAPSAPQQRSARPAPPAPPQRNARPAPPAASAPQPRNLMPAAPAPRQRRGRREAVAVPSAPSQVLSPQAAPSQAGQSQAGQSQAGQSKAGQSEVRPHAARAVSGTHRMPFVLLLCGLLGGALVSALVISTTLAEGSYQITRLQQSTGDLARQRQILEDQVAQAQSAQVIESRALKLGMRTQGQLRFVNLKTGKTSSDQGTGWQNAIHVPGYTP